MKNVLLVAGLMLFVIFNCFAQEIKIEKSFSGFKYYQGDEKVCFKVLGNIMQDNKEASFYYSKAKSNKLVATVTSFAVGYSLASAVSGYDGPNLALVGVGVGLIVVSIPLNIAVKKNTRRAIDVFNKDQVLYLHGEEDSELLHFYQEVLLKVECLTIELTKNRACQILWVRERHRQQSI